MYIFEGSQVGKSHTSATDKRMIYERLQSKGSICPLPSTFFALMFVKDLRHPVRYPLKYNGKYECYVEFFLATLENGNPGGAWIDNPGGGTSIKNIGGA